MMHLTPEQVVAYRDGELHSEKVARHLMICLACQAKVLEAQHLAAAIQGPLPELPARHPAPERLAAYFDAVLPARQRASIWRHLRCCQRCATVVITLQQTLNRLREAPEPPALAGSILPFKPEEQTRAVSED